MLNPWQRKSPTSISIQFILIKLSFFNHTIFQYKFPLPLICVIYKHSYILLSISIYISTISIRDSILILSFMYRYIFNNCFSNTVFNYFICISCLCSHHKFCCRMLYLIYICLSDIYTIIILFFHYRFYIINILICSIA
jgi:hypothetical protein